MRGSAFGLDEPALCKLGQGASDDLDGRRPFQGDPRHPLARLRELSPEPTSRPTFTLRPLMPVTKQSPMPGISSSRTSLSLVPEDDLTAADAVVLGFVTLAFEVLDKPSA